MAAIRLSPEAEADLDSIWLYLARESGDVDFASRVVDEITQRFWLLARYPYIDRSRDHDLGLGLRSFSSGDYIILHRVADDGDVLILRVVHGRRDIVELFGE